MPLQELVLDFQQHVGTRATEVILYVWYAWEGFLCEAVADQICWLTVENGLHVASFEVQFEFSELDVCLCSRRRSATAPVDNYTVYITFL